MDKRYEIRTLKDIFDKVPADRWETMIAELLPMFRQADAIRTLAREVSTIVGVGPETVVFEERIVWIDDDTGELTTRVCATEDPSIGFSVKSTRRL